jgi:hypothetical protein
MDRRGNGFVEKCFCMPMYIVKWVGAMNNIKVCAEEIVLKEIVYL